MRMLLLAGAVAVATLAAVVVVGLRVVDDDEPTWPEQASKACERGLAEARAAVAAGNAVTDAEQRTVELYASATEIEGGVLAELEALPRPPEDELVIEQTLAILQESHETDMRAVRALRFRFDPVLLQRRIDDTVAILGDVRARFRSLGADDCVSYYDPASYG
jgi:hypothetical protein